MAGKLSGSVNAQAHIGITVDASGAINAAKQLGVLGNALQSLMRGNKISDYWNSQLSSLDAVSDAYERFIGELGKPMPSKSLAEELVKGFNAFLAQGGEAQALIERYGAEVTDVVAKARNLAPEIENAFNVNFLSEAFDVFNGLDEAMKRTGNDINTVFSQLSSGDTTKLRSEIDELRNSLESATDYINTLQERIRDLNSLDAGQLQSELNSIRQKMVGEFKEWANVNGLGEHYEWGTFQEQINGIRDGSLTARDAIAQVKYEYDDLIREASASGEVLGSGTLEIAAKMEALDAAMADIQARMAGGMAMTGTGGTVATGGIQEDVIRRVADAMIEFSAGASEAGQSADSAVEKITALVQSLTNFGSVDSGNLETIRNMFGLISQFNRLSVSNASMENLRTGIESLMAVANSAGTDKINALRDLSRVDFKSFNELHVSKASLSNLAEFLPTIGAVNIEPLKQLAGLRWDNLKEMKVSKASVENLANLAKIADTIEELRARIDAAGIPTTTQVTPGTGVAGSTGGAIEAEAAAHEHAADAARDHAAAEREAATAESEHASAAQMDAEAARDAAAAEQELSSAAAAQTDIAAQIEQGAAAHEHTADAARQQAAAEMEVVQAEEQAAAGSGVIEETAGAHEAATEAAHGHAEAEHEVSQATEEAAASGERIEQAASAHERAAQTANEQAAAEETVASAEQRVASESDSVAASAEAAANSLKNVTGELSRIESFAGKGLSGLTDVKYDAEAVAEVTQRYQRLQAVISEYRTGQKAVDAGTLAQLRAEANAIQETIVAIRRKASEQEAEAKAARQNAAEKRQNAAEEQRSATQAANMEKRVATMRAQVSNYINSNTRAYQAYRVQLDAIMNDLQGGNVDSQRLSAIATEFANIKAAAQSAGVTGQTFFEKLKAGWAKFAGWSLVSRSFMLVIRGFKQMVNSVKEIDLAMTELRKVTDLTAVGYENFYQQAVDATTRIGATISDTINATADFARLGYDVSESLQLAEAAVIYQHVGDGISDISQATESIISTMKAFKIEASDAISVVDELNEVGNNFAISSTGIGEALQRSASALYGAGNTLEESIGLITAANAIVQNPESVGERMRPAA